MRAERRRAELLFRCLERCGDEERRCETADPAKNKTGFFDANRKEQLDEYLQPFESLEAEPEIKHPSE